MQRLYFNHISKTAGTALVSLLEMHVPRELVCPADTIDELREIPPEKLAEFALFRGPFANEVSGRLPEPPVTVTVLRDPIERAISHYHMTARTPPSSIHPFSRLAAVLPVSEAIEHPAFWYMFSNYQARYLTLELTEEVLSWTPPVSGEHPFIIQVLMDFYPIERNGLESRSIESLLRYDVVGVTEYVWDTYDQVCDLMNWEGRIEPKHRNTGDAETALSQLLDMPTELFDRLLTMNTVDWLLYEVAKHKTRARCVPLNAT